MMSAHERDDGQLDDDKVSSGEQELATRTVQIQSKRFYLDVKQNRMGRFIKIAEIYVGAGGRKSRLLLPMSTSAELCEKLTEFGEYYTSLGPPNSNASGEEGLLKSAVISKETRRYYLDLKENRRGRFLRISQLASLTGQRSQVAIPAQGIIEIRDALTDLLKQFGSDDLAVQPQLPEPKTLRGENKTFYFDVGSNRRGIYLRISEVRANMRTAITVPEQNWAAFRDTISQFIESSPSLSAAGSEASQEGNGAAAAAAADGCAN